MALPSTADIAKQEKPRGLLGGPRRDAGWDELVLDNVALTFNKGKANEYRALDGASMTVRRDNCHGVLSCGGRRSAYKGDAIRFVSGSNLSQRASRDGQFCPFSALLRNRIRLSGSGPRATLPPHFTGRERA